MKEQKGQKQICTYIYRNESYNYFYYSNVSQIACKIFATQCSFTDRMKHKIVNKTACWMPSAIPCQLKAQSGFSGGFWHSISDQCEIPLIWFFNLFEGALQTKQVLKQYKKLLFLILSLEIFRIVNIIAAFFSLSSHYT